MPHGRTQLRTAVGTAFASLSTPVTVEAERRHRLDPSLLPAVLYMLDDAEPETDQRTMGQPTYNVEESQTLTVELVAEGATGLDVATALDQLDLETEAALSVDLSLGGIAENVEPAGSRLVMETEQDRVIGTRTVQYAVTWRHAFGAPDTPEG